MSTQQPKGPSYYHLIAYQKVCSCLGWFTDILTWINPPWIIRFHKLSLIFFHWRLLEQDILHYRVCFLYYYVEKYKCLIIYWHKHEFFRKHFIIWMSFVLILTITNDFQISKTIFCCSKKKKVMSAKMWLFDVFSVYPVNENLSLYFVNIGATLTKIRKFIERILIHNWFIRFITVQNHFTSKMISFQDAVPNPKKLL